ncbi:MAG: hypothetical protein DDG60_09280 [Anaerolineae bacterium]|nr:MAG: hypothetical protein DDG60_09280 [Anaerolineae bacterium]
MNLTQRLSNEQRGWLWVGLVVLIGLLSLCLAGEIAIRLAPYWSLVTDMNSRINPDELFAGEPTLLPLPPVSSEIETPPAWWDTFLTPQSPLDPFLPPIILTFAPPSTFTPTPTQKGTVSTPLPTTMPSLTVPPTATWTPLPYFSPTPIVIIWPTRTNTPFPTALPSSTRTPTATITLTPTITITLSITPTATVTTTATQTATLTLTPTETLTPTATPSPTETATITLTPTQTETPTETSTPTATATIAPPPPDVEIGPGDNDWGWIADGGVLIIDMGTFLISTSGNATPDMVFYERLNGPGIYMDCLVIQLGNSAGGPWYQVFYWCDGTPDTNTNIAAYPENDNEFIPDTVLYHPAPPPQNGVTIDIDPFVLPGTYRYVRLYAPPGGASDGAEVDAIGLYP